jgi:hypothetical protein
MHIRHGKFRSGSMPRSSGTVLQNNKLEEPCQD